ncbi:MAG: GNAT family N-acetyltransferase [Chloroflexi bacterium]|nr:GNAT family N-acetyltransferase [Chloroflexota bacterium]
MGTLAPRTFWLPNGVRLVVRTAALDDAAELRAISAEVVGEMRYSVSEPDEFNHSEEAERTWIARHLDRPDHLLLVGEANGHVVGHLGLDCSGRRRMRHRALLHISVARGWRGRGVGTALIGSSLDWAAANPQIEKVALEVLADNTAAQALYRRFGFAEEGRRVREIKRGPGSYVDAVLMYRFVKAMG